MAGDFLCQPSLLLKDIPGSGNHLLFSENGFWLTLDTFKSLWGQFSSIYLQIPLIFGDECETAAPVGRAWVLPEREERKPWVDTGDGLSFPAQIQQYTLLCHLHKSALCCFNGKYNL